MYTVDRLTDDGSGSDLAGDLRYCITQAIDGDSITSGVTGTINLTRALPNLTHSISIQGPGADLLTVRRNTGGDYRIFTVPDGTTVSIADLRITNGHAGYSARSGGIFNSGTLTVSNSTISGNAADYPGAGGIFNSGTLTVSNSTIFGNRGAAFGGGIFNSGNFTLSNSTVSGNSATSDPYPGGYVGFGGGIYNQGTVTISSSTISGNQTEGSLELGGNGAGGGIYNEGTVTISSTTISGNTGGGGIDNNYLGTLTVSNSTVSGNSGGGISNQGTLTVSNSTVSGNSGDFGGIGTNSTHPVTLTSVSLTANRANTAGGSGHGGGLSVSSGTPVLHNTLIAGNFRGATGTTTDDVFGALNPSGDYNLIGDGTGMTGLSHGVNGNLVGSADAPIDPLLGPLQDNGGPTLTHALLSGSPAIDAGNNAYATDWDQRGEGFPRIVGILDPDNPIIDIGAFEVQDSGGAPREFGQRRIEASFIVPAGSTAFVTPIACGRSVQETGRVDRLFALAEDEASLTLLHSKQEFSNTSEHGVLNVLAGQTPDPARDRAWDGILCGADLIQPISVWRIP